MSSLSLEIITDLVPDCDEEKLREELLSFSSMWEELSKSTTSKHEAQETVNACTSSLSDDEFGLVDEVEICNDVMEDEDQEFDVETEAKELKSIKCYGGGVKCNSCFKCAFDVIKEYNMYSRVYTELFKVYKYLLTLPATQVSCERSFSKLKYIKTRLRSRLTDEHLQSLFLMNCERDILTKIDNNKIINKMCEKSSEMRRLYKFKTITLTITYDQMTLVLPLNMNRRRRP